MNVTTGSGCSWTASSSQSWLTITSGGSGNGNGTINYSVAANPGSGQRTATITVQGQTLTVTQAGSDPVPANDQCSGAIALANGVGASLNTANATSTGDPTPPCQSNFGKGVWYTFTPASSGLVTVSTCGSSFDTVLSVYTGTCGSLTPLPEGCNDDDGPACSTLQASVSFQGTAGTTYRILVGGFGGENGNLQILATSSPCSYALSSGSASFPASGGNGSVNVATGSGCNWTASSSQSWLTITSGSSGSGNGTINYSVAANPASGQRTATITVQGQTLTVTQAGVPCSYALSSGSASFPASGGNGSVGVTTESGCSWTASSSQGWLTITSGSSGSGNGTINYSVAANPGSSSRTATITVQGQTLTVTQPGPDTEPVNDQCAGAIALVSGASASLNTANATSTGDPTPPCQSSFGKGVWYTFTPASSGLVTISTCGSSFDTVLTVYTGTCGSLTPLPDGCNDDNGPACSTLQASVSFQGTVGTTYRILAGGFGGESGNLQILATLSPCSYALSSGSASFPASGGNGSVNVTTGSGCNWTASSSQGWLAVTSGSSGSGNGTINYSVAANPGSGQRTATITVQGQTLTITQMGVSLPALTNPRLTGTTFTLSLSSQIGFNYVLEFKNSLNEANWTAVQTVGGTGGTIDLKDTGATGLSRLYRVRVQ